MRIVLICLLSMCVCSCVKQYIKPYPSGWPDPNASLLSCSDVAGVYEDVRHEPSASGSGFFKARWFFNLHDPAVYSSKFDRTIKLRAFQFSFETDGALKLTYFLDGEPVFHRVFAAKDQRCENGMLTLNTEHYMGWVHDLIPNYGVFSEKVTIFRIHRKSEVGNLDIDELYANVSSVAFTFDFYIVPDYLSQANWANFPAIHR